jgi:hypothetical protein
MYFKIKSVWTVTAITFLNNLKIKPIQIEERDDYCCSRNIITV